MCGIGLFPDPWLPLCGASAAQPWLFLLLSKQPYEDRGSPPEKNTCQLLPRLQVVPWNTHAIIALSAFRAFKAEVIIIFLWLGVMCWCSCAKDSTVQPLLFITIILSPCHLLGAVALRRICASHSGVCLFWIACLFWNGDHTAVHAEPWLSRMYARVCATDVEIHRFSF